jgi:hypothetical protein
LQVLGQLLQLLVLFLINSIKFVVAGPWTADAAARPFPDQQQHINFSVAGPWTAAAAARTFPDQQQQINFIQSSQILQLRTPFISPRSGFKSVHFNFVAICC